MEMAKELLLPGYQARSSACHLTSWIERICIGEAFGIRAPDSVCESDLPVFRVRQVLLISAICHSFFYSFCEPLPFFSTLTVSIIPYHRQDPDLLTDSEPLPFIEPQIALTREHYLARIGSQQLPQTRSTS